MMLPQLAYRILRTTDTRLLWKFAWNFGIKGALSVEKFKRRIKRRRGRASRQRGIVLVAVLVLFTISLTLFGLWSRAVARERVCHEHRRRLVSARLHVVRVPAKTVAASIAFPLLFIVISLQACVLGRSTWRDPYRAQPLC